MADYVSGEEKCGAPAPNVASVCALPKGHDGGHRNVRCPAIHPTSPWPCLKYAKHTEHMDALYRTWSTDD